ncbi:hypothetical protein [Leptospira santarosai]|uniref:hypothetical protein n=1 Tax=Leptospira santarosai TaxID=28183 RepID=UPI001E4CD497
MLYSIVGISKQGFHQWLSRYLSIQEEQGYLLGIVREIREDHPKIVRSKDLSNDTS